MNRRTLIQSLAAIPSAGLALPALAKATPKVVIIGGGFGGASAALYLRKIAPSFDVTLIEANPTYTACPFSNLVITGARDLSQQQFDYRNLNRAGVRVIIGRATHIDADAKHVTVDADTRHAYDRLIVSPGIDIIWNAVEGYDFAASETLPHAWKAGEQTVLLKRQLHAMPDGGTVAMSIPPAPFRCPPGPYERASLIAHYLKTHKPRAKLLILDAQDNFSKKPLFEAAWQAEYADIIERIPGGASGRVIRVDSGRVNPASKTLFTDFDTITADVANVIPPQRAGAIAQMAGLTDASGWCPIDALTFESRLQPDIHVIGDATIAAPMPKSAFAANLHGKVCAAQITRMLTDQPPLETILTNTCYSFTDPDTAFSVSGVYQNIDRTFQPVPGAGGTSPVGDYPALRQSEALQAKDWFRAVTREAFG